jgi:hypothetical protein
VKSRRTLRWLLRRRSPRTRAAILLAAWFASLWLPLFHADDASDGAKSAKSSSSTAVAHECAGHFLAAESQPSVRASCPGKDCNDPFHHHHPIAHHDAAQCPICSSLVERLAETPVLFDAAPDRVERVALEFVRLPPLAQRLVVALARGPPSAPSAIVDDARVA